MLATEYLWIVHHHWQPITRPQPVMLKILPIMFLRSAQKLAHYDHHYAHES